MSDDQRTDETLVTDSQSGDAERQRGAAAESRLFRGRGWIY